MQVCNAPVPSGNGWSAASISGFCYNFNFCYDVPTSQVSTIISTHLEGKEIVSSNVKPNTGGAVTQLCYKVVRAAGLEDVTITPYSKCNSATMLTPQSKGLCAFEGSIVEADTGDDMFKIRAGSGGAYVEYPSLGDLETPLRLRWVERGSGGQTSKAVMLPSGPPGTFKDFQNFMRYPPNGVVEVEPACYPVNAKLCEEAPIATAPPTPGLCGAAEGKNFESASDIPAGDRCYIGTPTAITLNGSQFRWSCGGIPASQPADNCTASLYVPEPEPEPPTGQPPTDRCFFQVSGGFLGYSTHEGSCGNTLGVADGCSNILGAGSYPITSPWPASVRTSVRPQSEIDNYSQAQYAFLHADATTLDSLALGPDTHVVIYDQPNFEGNVIFEMQGPALQVDDMWNYVSPLALKLNPNARPLYDKPKWDGTVYPYPEPYNTLIPFENRTWGNYPFNYLGGQKSVVVTCAAQPVEDVCTMQMVANPVDSNDIDFDITLRRNGVKVYECGWNDYGDGSWPNCPTGSFSNKESGFLYGAMVPREVTGGGYKFTRSASPKTVTEDTNRYGHRAFNFTFEATCSPQPLACKKYF